MKSNDQDVNQSEKDHSEVLNWDQPAKESKILEVNWQKLTPEQLLVNYKSLQAQFTRKTQELSETKKRNELSEEDQKAVDFLRQNDFLTKQDLEGYAAQRQQEVKLSEIINSNPNLQTFETAIKDLSKNTWLAPEDVIEKYGFNSTDKLSKAKWQWDVKGSPPTQTKLVKDMTMAEYEQWRKERWIWKSWTFS